MLDMIVFPSSFFHITEVDEDLKQEYDAAVSTGLFQIVFFDYEKWFHENTLVLWNAPDKMHLAVYRGWMMKPEQYEQFYHLLLEKNIRLVTTPEEYKLMHIFPNVYEFLMEDTAKMEIYPLHEHIDVEKLKKSFDRFLIKDFVKSVKGTEFPAFFDQTITQDKFEQWMEVFYKYRGGLLTGGICIKEFLNLRKYESKTNEYRVFYMNHEPATICRNSGQGMYTPTPPKSLIDKYKYLNSVYYTLDYAELEDGTWKIIEAGDGEVSGLSENQDYEQYFRVIFQSFR